MNGLSWADLLAITAHFAVLSVLAVGGAITTASDMHRFLVAEHGWLADEQFSASIAIAQAAPGPNLLFVAVLGWNVAGPAGMLATLVGTLVPSSLLALQASRWAAARRDSREVRAFVTGMAPMTIGLLVATGWVLAEPFLRQPEQRWGAAALILLSIVAMLRTRLGPIWLVALGALVGAVGGV